MTLPAFATIDEVPEPFRPFAKADDTGKVSLDLVPGAELVGLKRKNAELIAREADLKARFADVDPDEYKNLKANKGKALDLDERLKAAAAEKDALAGELTKLRGTMRKDTKDTAIARAISASEGANMALLEPTVAKFVDIEEIDGAMVVVVRTPKGAVRYKNGDGDLFGVSDLLAEMKENPMYKDAWKIKVGSGGGATPGSGGQSGVRTITAPDNRSFGANLDDIASGKVKVA